MSVPSTAHNCFLTAQSGSGTAFQTLGPFSEGDILRALHVTLFMPVASTVTLAFSHGGGIQANLLSLNAGKPLIERSLASLGTTPAWIFASGIGTTQRILLPLGIRFTVGSQFVICAMVISALTPVSAIIGIESVRDPAAAGRVQGAAGARLVS